MRNIIYVSQIIIGVIFIFAIQKTHGQDTVPGEIFQQHYPETTHSKEEKTTIHLGVLLGFAF